ncbi:MAG TPA: hypothetical protein ENF52_06505 [Chloroflexi bacterium]|nr:hypothetical protein [Chloroflexota bacterium]
MAEQMEGGRGRSGCRRTLIWALGVSFLVTLVVMWIYRPAPSEPVNPSNSGGGSEQFTAWSDSTVFPTSLDEGPTAQAAYATARDTALAWQPDAQPAIVSAHWRPRADGHWPTMVVWSFQFYSPGTQRVAVIAVDGGQAQLLQDTLSPYVLSTFDETMWQVDSLMALEVWWEEGGAFFAASHPSVDLTAQLRISQESGRLVWTVIGVSGGQMRRVMVDGVTGEQL